MAHTILLESLHTTSGLSHFALKLTYPVRPNMSHWEDAGLIRPIICGVLQESVLCPVLFTFYMLTLPATRPSAAMACINTCLKEIKAWMSKNFFHLNSSKTETFLIGTSHHVQSSLILHLTLDGQDSPPFLLRH